MQVSSNLYSLSKNGILKLIPDDNFEIIRMDLMIPKHNFCHYKGEAKLIITEDDNILYSALIGNSEFGKCSIGKHKLFGHTICKKIKFEKGKKYVIELTMPKEYEYMQELFVYGLVC